MINFFFFLNSPFVALQFLNSLSLSLLCLFLYLIHAKCRKQHPISASKNQIANIPLCNYILLFVFLMLSNFLDNNSRETIWHGSSFVLSPYCNACFMQPPSITPSLRIFVSQLKRIPISVNNEHCYVCTLYLFTEEKGTLLLPCIMCYALDRHLQYRFTKTVNSYESRTTRRET